MLFLSIGDSMAAIVGQAIGRISIGHKSLEGTLACFTACALIALPTTLTWPVALAGAATAAVVELMEIPILNDNVAIPLFSGAVMYLLVTIV